MLNRTMKRANKVEINGGKVEMKTAKKETAKKRNEVNLSIIANQIRNRKRISKDKALKLAKIQVAKMLEGDKTSFMSLAFSELESQVGKITNNMSTICSLTKNAWVKENGAIDTKLFYNAFKCCDKKNPGIKDHWDTIFTEDTASLTKGLRLQHCTNMVYDVYYISNIEIVAFKNQLMDLDPKKIGYEDIVAIQNDLYHLFRAFQESSIDVTKDKAKDFAIKWDEIIGYVPRIFSNHVDDYIDNLEEVIKDRNIAYDILVDSKDEAKQIRNDNLCDSLLVAHTDFINSEILATADDSITEIMREVVGMSNNLTTDDKLHAESIISIVAASFKAEDSLTDEEYKAIRNALYTIAAQDADDAETATGIILDLICAKYRITHRGELVRNNDISKIRLGCAKMILGGILPLYLNNKSSYTRVFGHKEFTMFQELEDGQRFEIEDGDIIADSMIVGCLNFNAENEEEICSIVTDAAYVIEGQLYIEQDIYEDIDCETETLIIDALYNEASVQDVKDGNADDNYGETTYNDMLEGGDMAITGKAHNILVMEDANGMKHIRGRVNDHTANMLAGESVLSINKENSIAVHVPFNPEEDDNEYCCEVLVFC